MHRRAVDLEPLQPLLKKFIGLLETEVLPSTLKTSRPRVQLERTSIWIGVKNLYELRAELIYHQIFSHFRFLANDVFFKYIFNYFINFFL